MSYNDISSLNVDGVVESSMQGKLIGSFDTMPTASADYLGLTVQYIGTTSASYTQDAFYRCVQNGSAYEWQKVTTGKSDAGSANHPVYITSGVPTQTTFELNEAGARAVDSVVTQNSVALPTSGAVFGAINDATVTARQRSILWDATLTYPSGAVVNVADALYMSKVDNNIGHSPATSPSQWEEIELGSATPQPDINPCNVYKTTIGDGVSKVFTITHNLDTYDVDATIYNTDADHLTQITRMERPSVNTVRLTFSAAPSSSGLTVIVFRPGTSVSSVAGQTGVVTASALRTALNVADGAEVNVQANWTEADSSSDAYILNKPSLAMVATSGAYSDLSGTPTLGTAAAVNTGTSAGNVPVLDSNGKLADSVLPDLSISEFVGTVTLNTDLAGLTAQKGDWAQVVGDTAANNGSYIFTGSAWVRMASAAEVSSVNGHTGAVTLRQTATISGDGSTTTFTVPHALGVVPIVSVYESTGALTGTRMTATTSNVVLTFYSAPAVGDTFTVVMNE